MKHKYYILEADLINNKRIIHVMKDVSYRESISHSAFFSYKHKRNHKIHNKHFFMRKWKSDLRFDWGFTNTKEIYSIKRHNSLYDFYNYVGYDRAEKVFK